MKFKRQIAMLLAFVMIFSSIPGFQSQAKASIATGPDYQIDIPYKTDPGDNNGLISKEQITPQADDTEEINIPCKNLYIGIKNLYGEEDPDVSGDKIVSKGDMRRIWKLSPEKCVPHNSQECGVKVSRLYGIEYAENLLYVSLPYQRITNLKPLENLTGIKFLNLHQNEYTGDSNTTEWQGVSYSQKVGDKIEDITPLANLKDLEYLDLFASKPGETVNTLAGLTKLRVLDLEKTDIKNIDFAKNLKELAYFNVNGNEINDISALEGLSKMQILKIANNKSKSSPGISDLSFLKNMKDLEDLEISNHNIKDLSPLQANKNLRVLIASGNPLEDMSVLKKLPNLTKVVIDKNSEANFTEAKTAYNKLNKIAFSQNDKANLKGLLDASEGIKAFFSKEELTNYQDALASLEKGIASVDNNNFTMEYSSKLVIAEDYKNSLKLKLRDKKDSLPKTVKVKAKRVTTGISGQIITNPADPSSEIVKLAIIDNKGQLITKPIEFTIDQQEVNGKIADSKSYTSEAGYLSLPMNDFEASIGYEIKLNGFVLYTFAHVDGKLIVVNSKGENIQEPSKIAENLFVALPAYISEEFEDPKGSFTPGEHKDILTLAITRDGKLVKDPIKFTNAAGTSEYTSKDGYLTLDTITLMPFTRVHIVYEGKAVYTIHPGMANRIEAVENKDGKHALKKDGSDEDEKHLVIDLSYAIPGVEITDPGNNTNPDPGTDPGTEPDPGVNDSKLGISVEKNTEYISFKVLDPQGNLLSATDNPNLIKATNVIPHYNQTPAIDGDYFKFKSVGESLTLNIELNSDKYDLIGRYSFDTDYGMTIPNNKITSVVNGYTGKSYKISDNPGAEAFIIRLKDKGSSDPIVDPTPEPEPNPEPNPVESKIGYVDGKVVIKVVDEKGTLLKASEISKDLTVKLDEFNSMDVDGDYFSYTIEAPNGTSYNPLSIESEKYELISKIGFAAKSSWVGPATITKVFFDGVAEDVIGNKADDKYFTLIVKEKGTTTPNPEPNPVESKIGYVDGKVVIKVVDEKGTLLKASEISKDLTVKLDEFKAMDVDGDYFSYTIEAPNGTSYNPLSIESEKYELISKIGFSAKSSWDGTSKITKVYFDGTEEVVADNKADDKYFTLIVKEKGTTTPNPEPNPVESKIGYVDGKVVIKVVDEKGTLLKASEISKDLTVKLDEFKAMDVDGDYFSYTIKAPNGTTYNPLSIESEKYELVNKIGFAAKSSWVGPATITKVFYDDVAVDVVDNKADDKYFTLIVKEKGTTTPTPNPEPNPNPKPEPQPTTGSYEDKIGYSDNQKSLNFVVLDENDKQVTSELNFAWVSDDNGAVGIKFTFADGIYNVKSTMDMYKYNLVLTNNDYDLEGTYTVQDGYPTFNYIEKNYNKSTLNNIVKDNFIINVKSKISTSASLSAFAYNLAMPMTEPAGENIEYIEVPVKWDTANFDTSKAGTFELTGEFILEDGLTNPEGHIANLNVTVEDDGQCSMPEVTVKQGEEIDYSPLKDCLVPYENLEDITNPPIDTNIPRVYTAKVLLTLDNGDKIEVPVKVTVIAGETPVEPEKPTEPEKPVEPEDPVDEEKPEMPKDNEKPAEKPAKRKLLELSGADRYETAVAISKETFKSADTVVLASGEVFPDALAASTLAINLDAPLLLSNKTSLNGVTKDEITRLGAKKVLVIGGENTLSTEVENSLREMGVKIERIAGEDRYKTSEAIAKKLIEKRPEVKTIILADGRNYPDSLAVGPYAGKEGMAILLTNGNSLSEEAKTILGKMEKAILVGGENSVPAAIENELKGIVKTIERIAGKDRYETASMIANKFYPNAKTLVLASGENFADALAGSVIAAKEAAPSLLVRKNEVSEYVKTILDKNDVKKVIVLGGQNSISSQVREEVK